MSPDWMHQSLKGSNTLLRIELIIRIAIRRNRPSYQHPYNVGRVATLKPLYNYPKLYPKSKRGLLPFNGN